MVTSDVCCVKRFFGSKNVNAFSRHFARIKNGYEKDEKRKKINPMAHVAKIKYFYKDIRIVKINFFSDKIK